ncbi:MAG: hypothetical protein ABJG88_04895 [Litorimonas sp.]
MRIIRYIAFLLCLNGMVFTTSCSPANNHDTKSETLVASSQALRDRVKEFEAIFDSDDIGETMNFIPPKTYEALKKGITATDEEMKNSVNREWKKALETISVESFTFELDENSIQTSSIGRAYTTLPLTMVMGINSDPTKLIKATSTTVALVDAGVWYIVRLDEPSLVGLFKKSYPDLSTIAIAPATQEIVTRKAVQ